MKSATAQTREAKQEPRKEFATPGELNSGSNAVYVGGRGDWAIVLTRTRESSVLENSNFHAALEQLGGEGRTVAVEPLGEVEYLIVKPTARKRIETARGIHRYLKDRAILDEEDYSDREHEAFEQSWQNGGRDAYKKALADHFWEEFKEEGGFMDERYDRQDWYALSELYDGILELEDEQLDEFERDTAVDCLYRAEGSGVTINIDGLVEKTDLMDLFDAVADNLRQGQYIDEIKKLGALLGAAERHVQEALKRGITLISEFQSLVAQGCV